jgi:hypothetical protein
LRHPALPEQRAATRSGDASDQERQSVALGMKAHIGVDAKSGLTHSLVTTASQRATSISRVICFMERSNLSQPMPLPRSATARGAGRCG